MSALFVTLAILLVLVGILGTVIPGLPGAVLVLADLLWLAWLDGFDRLGPSTIILLVILTIAFHAIDLLATTVGARRFGASRRAVGGAFVGTIVGVVLWAARCCDRPVRWCFCRGVHEAPSAARRDSRWARDLVGHRHWDGGETGADLHDGGYCGGRVPLWVGASKSSCKKWASILLSWIRAFHSHTPVYAGWEV